MATNPTPLDRARQLATRLSPMQKIALGAVVLTVVAGGLVLSRASSGPALTPLYTDLSSADAASVVDALSSRGVAYDLTDAGRTVLVPKDQVYDLRVALAGDGLPTSNEGYALLDNQGITTSEFRQRIDYQRALEGELAKTINALQGVQGASVHLALPEQSVFVDQPATPTASVLVASRGLDGITASEVEAIVHLVASSVKDMKPEGVTVVDASGAVLSAGGTSTAGGVGAGSDRARVVADYENRMAAAITALVTRMTGPNKVAVKVTADLDLDQSQVTSERFEQPANPDGTPGSGQVVNERTSEERYGPGASGGNGATGVLGPDGAQTGEEAAADSLGTGEYARADADRQFALDRVVEQRVNVPGTVTRMNVAVLVDEEAVTAEQAAAIEEMVAVAAAIDPENRGDQVKVTRMPFDTSLSAQADDLAAAEQKAQSKAEMMGMIRTGAILFVIVVALFLGYRSAKNARRITATPIQIGELAAASRPSLGAGPMAQEPAPEPFNPFAMAMKREPSPDDLVMNELTMMADRRPQEVADVLKTWLSESKPGVRTP